MQNRAIWEHPRVVGGSDGRTKGGGQVLVILLASLSQSMLDNG